MARRKQKWHGWRGLLNRPGYHSTGAIVAEIEDTTSWKEGCDGDGKKLAWTPGVEYVLQISDCSRAIVLDLNFNGPQDYSNNLYKVDTMIKALTKFRDGLEIEQKLHEQRRQFLKSNNLDD